MGGVDPFDVECRIGLRIAQGLGVAEDIRKAPTLVAHFGKNEVTGTIDDAGQPLHGVACEALPDRLDDRNASSDSGFKGYHESFFPGLGEDFISVKRNERLVGSYNVFAVLQGLENQFAGRINPADQFDDDVDFRVIDDTEGVARQVDALDVTNSRARQVSCGCRVDLDGPAGAAGDLTCVSLQHADCAAAHCAKTE